MYDASSQGRAARVARPVFLTLVSGLTDLTPALKMSPMTVQPFVVLLLENE
jgi:hypothetical protein